MLTWKQAYQNWFGCDGLQGIIVKRVQPVGAFSNADSACSADTPNVTVLATPDDTTTAGWADGTEYDVNIEYTTTQSHITVSEAVGGAIVADFTIVDDTFPSGSFGSVTFSQANACVGPLFGTCLPE